MDNEEKQELVMYATTDNGNGYVSEVGRFDCSEDVQIRVGLFARDVVLSFHWRAKEAE